MKSLTGEDIRSIISQMKNVDYYSYDFESVKSCLEYVDLAINGIKDMRALAKFWPALVSLYEAERYGDTNDNKYYTQLSSEEIKVFTWLSEIRGYEFDKEELIDC